MCSLLPWYTEFPVYSDFFEIFLMRELKLCKNALCYEDSKALFSDFKISVVCGGFFWERKSLINSFVICRKFSRALQAHQIFFIFSAVSLSVVASRVLSWRDKTHNFSKNIQLIIKEKSGFAAVRVSYSRHPTFIGFEWRKFQHPIKSTLKRFFSPKRAREMRHLKMSARFPATARFELAIKIHLGKEKNYG
jgi:hypothetical protein